MPTSPRTRATPVASTPPTRALCRRANLRRWYSADGGRARIGSWRQPAPEVRRQVRRRRVAPRRVLLQRLGHDRLHVAAQLRVDRAQPRRLLLQDQPGRLGQGPVLQLVRQPAGQQLEEDHPQGVHVGALVDGGGVGGHLLGAHVAGRAEQLAGLGQAGRGQQVGVGGAGHAEVEHLRLAGLVHQDVGGLEVAVDDALVVGVLHRVAHPRQQLQAGRRASAAVAAGVLVQGQAADELHGEERLAVLGQPGLVDLGDAGVVQPAEDLRLVGEALEQRGRGEAGADRP